MLVARARIHVSIAAFASDVHARGSGFGVVVPSYCYQLAAHGRQRGDDSSLDETNCDYRLGAVVRSPPAPNGSSRAARHGPVCQRPDVRAMQGYACCTKEDYSRLAPGVQANYIPIMADNSAANPSERTRPTTGATHRYQQRPWRSELRVTR